MNKITYYEMFYWLTFGMSIKVSKFYQFTKLFKSDIRLYVFKFSLNFFHIVVKVTYHSVPYRGEFFVYIHLVHQYHNFFIV